MPTKAATQRAHKAAREGKKPTTQAGAFVREEMHKLHQGEAEVSSPRQAVAIGLSKARRAGVKLPPPPKGKASAGTRRKARRDYEKGQGRAKTSPTRSRGAKKAAQTRRRRAKRA
ncbi:MAG TPA: DUF6496 domain-containing protein [Opitutaceae bacterium]